MGRSSFRIITVLTCTLTLALGTLTSHAATDWQVYTHPQYGFSLQFPPGWVLAHPDGQIIVMAVRGPASAGQPPFRMNVNVVADIASRGVTIENFNDRVEEVLQRIFPSYLLLRTDRTEVRGLPAVIRYATWHTTDGIEVYQVQLGVITAQFLYVVTGTTLASSPHLKDEALLLQQILTTFRPK